LIEGVLLAHVVLAVCSVAWSPAPTLTLIRGSQRLILFALALLIVKRHGTRNALNYIVSSLLGYVLIFGTVAAVIPPASGTLIDYYGIARFSWFAVHPTLAASLIALCVLFLLVEGTYGERGWRTHRFGIPIWLFVLPLITMLLATRTRTYIIALMVAAGLLVFLKVGRAWSLFLGLGTALAGVLWFLNSGTSVTMLADSGAVSDNPIMEYVFRGQSSNAFVSLTGRTDLWPHVFDLAIQKPLLGYGYAASRTVLLGALSWGVYAHNALGQAVLDLGVIGALLLFISLGSCFRVGPIAVWRGTLGVSALPRATIWFSAVYLTVVSIAGESIAGLPSFLVFCFLVFCVAAGNLRTKLSSLTSGDTQHNERWPQDYERVTHKLT
jgi:O-antigen ligase